MADVTINEAEIFALLNDPVGGLGELLMELAEQGTALAKAAAPVMVGGVKWPPSNYSRWGAMYDALYQYGPPGHTKAAIAPAGFRYNKLGQLYTGVNAPWGPTLFLEYGGGRYGHAKLHPFMTTAWGELALT